MELQFMPLNWKHKSDAIQVLSKMLEQTSGVSSPHQNKEKVPMSICPQTFSFCGISPMFVRSQFFRFLSVQILKNCSVLSWN
jgi:hypothetical protein